MQNLWKCLNSLNLRTHCNAILEVLHRKAVNLWGRLLKSAIAILPLTVSRRFGTKCNQAMQEWLNFFYKADLSKFSYWTYLLQKIQPCDIWFSITHPAELFILHRLYIFCAGWTYARVNTVSDSLLVISSAILHLTKKLHFSLQWNTHKHRSWLVGKHQEDYLKCRLA